MSLDLEQCQEVVKRKNAGMLSAEEADIYVESDEAPNTGDQ